MIILFLLFLIQFSIASSCLAVNSDQQKQFAEQGWNRVSDDLKKQVQDTFICCGFNSSDVSNPNIHPSCEAVTVRNFPFQIYLFYKEKYSNYILFISLLIFRTYVVHQDPHPDAYANRVYLS